MQPAAVQTIILSLAMAVLMMIGARSRLLNSMDRSSGRELILRALATIVIFAGVLFTLAECNAVGASHEQLAIVLLSVATTALVVSFNRQVLSWQAVHRNAIPTYKEPGCGPCAPSRRPRLLHRGSILRPNYGNILITTSKVGRPLPGASREAEESDDITRIQIVDKSGAPREAAELTK